jgi:CII-binding regulator of phage lambda lysogenization HflD
MVYHSISEASKLVKRSTRTLYRDIKKGKLTVTTSVTGESQVDTAELIRVYGEITTNSVTNVTVTTPLHDTHSMTEKDHLIDKLKAENLSLKERLNDKQQHIEHLAQAIQIITHKNTEYIHKNKDVWWKFWKKKS